MWTKCLHESKGATPVNVTMHLFIGWNVETHFTTARVNTLKVLVSKYAIVHYWSLCKLKYSIYILLVTFLLVALKKWWCKLFFKQGQMNDSCSHQSSCEYYFSREVVTVWPGEEKKRTIEIHFYYSSNSKLCSSRSLKLEHLPLNAC